MIRIACRLLRTRARMDAESAPALRLRDAVWRAASSHSGDDQSGCQQPGQQKNQQVFNTAPLHLTRRSSVPVCLGITSVHWNILRFRLYFTTECPFRKEKRRWFPTGASCSAFQPCFCLCFGFSQITITRPLRLMILHFSQMGLTDGRTFIVVPSLSGSVFAAPGDPASGQIIGR